VCSGRQPIFESLPPSASGLTPGDLTMAYFQRIRRIPCLLYGFAHGDTAMAFTSTKAATAKSILTHQ
jgi:hypothetical protein